MERGRDRQTKVQASNPHMVLDESPLLTNASIKDFQHVKIGYMANVMEQALLLLGDMADLRSMKKHEVFLSFKRNLALISLSIVFLLFRVAIAFSNRHTLSLKGCSSCTQGQGIGEQFHRQMKDEEGRRIATVEAFSVAEKRIQELNN